MAKEKKNRAVFRCPWCTSNQVMMDYHDLEWGVPVHDDLKHFEFILLDTFQAGLSWNIVLQKREGFSKAFSQFNYSKIARYNESKINALLNDTSIIRNKLKIKATVTNAQAFIRIQKEYKSFDSFIWKFTDGKTIHNSWNDQKQIPSRNEASDEMSKELYKRGFKFVGSTICYAYMQAAGMINDHLIDCHRHKKLI